MKKIILTIIGVMIMSAESNAAAQTAVKRPGDDDNVMCRRVLEAIGQVESGGKNIGVHPDGVSYGKYGVTMIAVRELHFREEGLKDPEENKFIARLYLQEMYRRHKCWFKATGFYHGGSREARDEYALKVFGIISGKKSNGQNGLN